MCATRTKLGKGHYVDKILHYMFKKKMDIWNKAHGSALSLHLVGKEEKRVVKMKMSFIIAMLDECPFPRMADVFLLLPTCVYTTTTLRNVYYTSINTIVNLLRLHSRKTSSK